MFRSVHDTWWNATHGFGDVKELIPEFYMTSTSFLRNGMNLDLGVTQGGERVDKTLVGIMSHLQVGDTLLPAWASSPEDFLEKNRQVGQS